MLQNRNFCTLFDYNYLHKGLALYQSLIDLNVHFHLYILAFDEKCYETLTQLNLPKTTIISLKEFETPELLAVKPTRNRAEYCWTSTASLIYYCITKFHLDACTYVDADLMFYSSPEIIFTEIANNSIAITEHIIDGPEMLEGKYCVQFMYFKNDEYGLKALIWWKDSCIDWCYARYEEGKFGDQKYIESFPVLFKNVSIIKNIGVGVAPWNVAIYDFSEYGKVKSKNQEREIVFYHYHGTKIDLKENKISIYLFDSDNTEYLEKNIYMPYLKLLGKIYKKYLNKEVNEYYIIERSNFKKKFAKIKLLLRNNKFFRFLYYDVIKVRYNGYEGNSNNN